MKTVILWRDFNYRPWKRRHVTIAYKAGIIYQRVPEAAVRAILAAKAGELHHGPVTLDDQWQALTCAQG